MNLRSHAKRRIGTGRHSGAARPGGPTYAALRNAHIIATGTSTYLQGELVGRS